MNNQKKFIVSHAPFWHNGSNIRQKSYHTVFAALPAALLGIYYYGIPALGVISLSISSAILWELLMNYATKRSISVGDGNAAMIGLIFGMLLPASMPWWAVITGTFFAIIIGKQIFGGIGSNPFNPAALSIAILMVSWKNYFDFNAALLNYDLDFVMIYPLTLLKQLGSPAADSYSMIDLIMGKQAGGIGSTFGLGLIVGGIYLMIRGFIRWEISVSFLAGIFITSFVFNLVDPVRFVGPAFHIFTGYTLIGAFFLITDDSSSPVNMVPMLIYGAVGGVMIVLIRNIGGYIDGVIMTTLLINLINPLLDKIRPKAMGKVV